MGTVEGVDQFPHGLRTEGVTHLRPVDGDLGHARPVLIEDIPVGRPGRGLPVHGRVVGALLHAY